MKSYQNNLDEAAIEDPRLIPLLDRFEEQNAGFWCPTGWYNLIITLDLFISPLSPEYQIGQIKEKFAGLRYYAIGVSPLARDLIRSAEAKSFSICQECGQPGKLRDHGWYATLCDQHYESRDRGYRSF